MWQILASRLKEPSTWRGLTLIITAAGVTLNPEQTAAIIAGGIALAGILGAFVPDKFGDK